MLKPHTRNNSKEKRQPSLLRMLWQRFQWGHILSYDVSAPVRTCTRRLSAMVCYPNSKSNLRRITDFVRIDNDVYAFEVRSKHYLGRGTYYLLSRIEGKLVYDEARQTTSVQGVLVVGWFYFMAILLMSFATLLSALIMQETLVFLPLWLLMTAMCLSHWWYLYSQWKLLKHDFEHHIICTYDAELSNASALARS